MNIVNFEKNYRGPIAELEDKCYVAVAKAERLMRLLNDLGKELSLWVVNISLFSFPFPSPLITDLIFL